VTNADFASNELIVAGLQEHFPLDGIVSEEAPPISGRRKWYIDPVDGTRSLVEHSEQFAVHIGFCEESSPTLGVIHKPVTGETYVGIVGQGAYKLLPTGARVSLSTEFVHDGLIAVAQTSWGEYARHNERFKKLGVTDVIISGSEGLRVLKLVEQLADFRVGNPGLHSWDACAPDAILRAGGGITLYESRKEVTYTGQALMDERLIYARNAQIWDRVAA
jgi:3'(2'), 5'-bisphosphate nucleotidase